MAMLKKNLPSPSAGWVEQKLPSSKLLSSKHRDRPPGAKEDLAPKYQRDFFLTVIDPPLRLDWPGEGSVLKKSPRFWCSGVFLCSSFIESPRGEVHLDMDRYREVFFMLWGLLVPWVLQVQVEIHVSKLFVMSSISYVKFQFLFNFNFEHIFEHLSCLHFLHITHFFYLPFFSPFSLPCGPAQLHPTLCVSFSEALARHLQGSPAGALLRVQVRRPWGFPERYFFCVSFGDLVGAKEWGVVGTMLYLFFCVWVLIICLICLMFDNLMLKVWF